MLHIWLKYQREVDLSKKRAETYYKAEVEYLHSRHGFQNTNYFIVTIGHLRHRLVGELKLIPTVYENDSDDLFSKTPHLITRHNRKMLIRFSVAKLI